MRTRFTRGGSTVAEWLTKTLKQINDIVASVQRTLFRKVPDKQYTILFYPIVAA